tara:strand:+ start:126 stop:527 length:402 start_codon:yes stop_codon:yes gene_type:complete
MEDTNEVNIDIEDDESYEDDCNDSDYDIDEETSIINTDNIEDISIFMKNYSKNKLKYTTAPILNKYELTRVLCERVQQIDNGSPPLISNLERFSDTYKIAVEELNQGKIPFIIRRPTPNNTGYEYWKINDLLI